MSTRNHEPIVTDPAATEPDVKFGVWDAADPDDRNAWLELWSAWPGREVAAHPGYAPLFADGAGQSAKAAYLKTPNGCVLYVFVLRPIEPRAPGAPAGRHDVTTPYGYGGPFCWATTDRERLAELFWPRFGAWCAERRVVSEFVRFSLLEDKLLAYPGESRDRLTNVVCPLGRAEEELWRGVKSKVRRNVNKARREGVAIVIDERGDRLGEFCRVYESTMRRREANQAYYFSEGFFESLFTSLRGHCALVHAEHGGEVVSSELVLLSADAAYYFLGGTDAASYDLRPNDLLKYDALLWANHLGKKHYVLGGGYQERDGVFKHKEAFAPEGLVTFRTGARVLDPAAYDALVGDRVVTDPAFFPRYRAA